MSDSPVTRRHPVIVCPSCSARLDASTVIQDGGAIEPERFPGEGNSEGRPDSILCAECGALLCGSKTEPLRLITDEAPYLDAEHSKELSLEVAPLRTFLVDRKLKRGVLTVEGLRPLLEKWETEGLKAVFLRSVGADPGAEILVLGIDGDMPTRKEVLIELLCAYVWGSDDEDSDVIS